MYYGNLTRLTVKESDRIAQFILEKITTPDVTEVEVSCQKSQQGRSRTDALQSLDVTIRGAGGFGSTGTA